MMLYHGSYMEIREPDIMHSRRNLDFGCGFYTTPLYLLVQKWCERFIRRGEEGVISCYRLDEIALERCRILKFDAYSGEWLYFKQYINRDAALDRLRYEKPNQQVCFKKQAIVDEYLHFEGSERLWMLSH